MRKLQGKRALITGAAGGIGRALALKLAAEKTDLYLLDINREGLEQLAEKARLEGVDVQTRLCDVTQQADIEAAVQYALDQWAGVDLLINNAGVTQHSFLNMVSDDDWQWMQRINLEAPILFTRRLLPSLLSRVEAHVVNMSSVLGLVGMPKVNAYCTSKFALVGFSESLRSEYGRWGLGVTAMCPGFVRTSLFSNGLPDQLTGTTKAPPLWLCTTPERVAKATVKAIRKNRSKVVMEPFARTLYASKKYLPSVMDFGLQFGRGRRMRRHALELEALSSDRTEAIRLHMAKEEAKRSRLTKPRLAA